MSAGDRLVSGLSFGARNRAYRTFRPTYPDRLMTVILGAMPSRHRSLAFDLGAGTGQATQLLLSHFDRVVAIEADPRMAGQIDPAANLEVVVSTAEAVEIGDSVADLITSGTAFYWMDGPKVVDHMRRWLKPDGLAAIYRYGLPEAPGPVMALVDREFRDHWDRFRHERLIDEGYSWRVVRESQAFDATEIRTVGNVHTMDAHRFVGFFGSTSFVGAYLRTLDDPDAYLAELEDEVRTVTGANAFELDFKIELILASAPRS